MKLVHGGRFRLEEQMNKYHPRTFTMRYTMSSRSRWSLVLGLAGLGCLLLAGDVSAQARGGSTGGGGGSSSSGGFGGSSSSGGFGSSSGGFGSGTSLSS